MNGREYTDARLQLLTPMEVAERWTEIRPLLARAAAHGHGELEVEDVLELVAQYMMAVFVFAAPEALRMAFAVRLHVGEQRTLEVVFAGGAGGVAVLRAHLPQLLDYARCVRAIQLRAYCRPVVARYLRRYLPGCSITSDGRYQVVTAGVPA